MKTWILNIACSKSFWIVLYAVCLSMSGFCQIHNQYRTQGIIIPWYCMDSASLDIENDGDTDIVSGHKGYSSGLDDTLTVYVNDGDQNYTQTYYVGNIPNDAVCTGDFNNDGFTDIASACWNNSIGVWYNDGMGGFGNFDQISTTRGGTVLKSIDIEGDGDCDLFYLNNNPTYGNYFGFYRNNEGGFNNYLHMNEAIPEDYLSLNDMDGDGVIDVVGGGLIYLNRGNHFEILQVLSGFNWVPATSTGDYDNDGDIDILIINPTTPLSLFVLENIGNSTFQEHPDYAIIPGYYSRISPIVVCDLNNDGFADFIYMNMVDAPILTDMYLHILINQDGTGFESQSMYFDRLGTIFWFNLMDVADLNSDGNMDILISSVSPNDENAYLNFMLLIMQTGSGLFEQWVDNDDPCLDTENNEVSIEVFPNPFITNFSKELTIKVITPSNRLLEENGTMKVFNLRGQLVSILTIDHKLEITWDCRDYHGKPVSTGVYVVSIQFGNRILNATKIVVYK